MHMREPDVPMPSDILSRLQPNGLSVPTQQFLFEEEISSVPKQPAQVIAAQKIRNPEQPLSKNVPTLKELKIV